MSAAAGSSSPAAASPWDPTAATAEVTAGASFMRCVDIARELCVALGGSPPSPPTPAETGLLDALLQSSNGARGFFVSYLGDPDVAIADAPPSAAVAGALHEAVAAAAAAEDGGGGGVVPPLLAKNLVMASAMVVHYRGEGKPDLAAGSDLTATRSRTMLAALLGGGGDAAAAAAAASSVPALRAALEAMRASVARALDGVRGEAGGEYGPFLVKWGYTDAQLGAMRDALAQVL